MRPYIFVLIALFSLQTTANGDSISDPKSICKMAPTHPHHSHLAALQFTESERIIACGYLDDETGLMSEGDIFVLDSNDKVIFSDWVDTSQQIRLEKTNGGLKIIEYTGTVLEQIPTHQKELRCSSGNCSYSVVTCIPPSEPEEKAKEIKKKFSELLKPQKVTPELLYNRLFVQFSLMLYGENRNYFTATPYNYSEDGLRLDGAASEEYSLYGSIVHQLKTWGCLNYDE